MIYPNRPALPRLRRKILPIAAALLATGFAQTVGADTFDLGRWPNPAAVNEMRGELVSYPSHSPFTLREVGGGAEEDPTTAARAGLFVPPTATAADPVPAVVLLHGAAGVLAARELTYARQFAAMGVAALVVDAFGARRDRATGFVERLLEVTETMVLADAYAGLRFLDARPEIDGGRVALIGFSYGGIAATLGAFEQTAETLSPDGPRFAAHISYYGPCIARFDDARATGAPVLMLAGSEDAIVDPMRCNQVLDDLRAGGAETEFVIYQNAFHQWDGSFRGPRPIGRNLADCRFKVGNDGVVRDSFTFLQMTGPISRRLILAACVDSDGYLIGRDDNVRAKSNRAVGDFLTRAFTR
ncbi:MAG: dienelactone hydrolase [Alphaproteobacteria bacterium]|nr:dienelactone hydrolase [Alphaproteobacteria bacterium]